MNQNEQQTLKKTFHNEMITLYKRIRKELKYTPPQLFEMINKYGGYEASIKFIITDMNTFVFTLLWENQRLDLSIEALITKSCYETLFPEDVIKFCTKRLQDYNYAPKVLPTFETKESKIKNKKECTLEASRNDASLTDKQVVEEKQHTIYTADVMISINDWEQLFLNDIIFTSKNKDLIIRMFLMGGCFITPEILAIEEGYTSKYPFKEVITSIGKRIKSTLKIDFPNSVQGKAMPWHLLFVGWCESNVDFSWSLRPELMEALKSLIDMHQVSIEGIRVKSTPQMLQVTQPYSLPTLKVIETQCQEVEEEKELYDLENEDPSDLDEQEIPHLELEDMPFEDDLFNNSIDQIYCGSGRGEQEELIEKPKRDPLPSISMDDLIDSIFELEAPVQKNTAKESKALTQSKVSNKVSTAPVMHNSVEGIIVEAKEIKQPEIKPNTTPIARVAIQDDLEDTVNQRLVDLKASCIEYYGAVCDICGFDFGYTYGEEFEQLIEIYPVDGKKLDDLMETIDPQKDIIPICSNCKSVLMSQKPSIGIEELKKKIK